MKDIESRTDIELLVNTFYQQVQNNAEIGPFFTEIAKVNWDTHLPKMYDFWEFLILGTGAYKGNVFTPHLQLNEKKALHGSHFEEWIRLFHQTVDSTFQGEKAEEIKQRASSIAGVMAHKLQDLPSGK